MVHTDPPVMFYTQVFALYEHFERHVLHSGGRAGSYKSFNSEQSGCWILHTLYVWCFTTRVIGPIHGNSRSLDT
jgi:hypothetical protein